jgi:tRNA(fMet)-specific endonuclease VapC
MARHLRLVRNSYLLDSDTIIDVLRGRRDVIDRLAAESPDDVFVSAMSVAELYYGALLSSDPGRNRVAVDQLLAQLTVLHFDAKAAAEHASIRAALRARTIGPADMIIAATALSVGAVVVTANVREFGRVPGVEVESWRGGARVASREPRVAKGLPRG